MESWNAQEKRLYFRAFSYISLAEIPSDGYNQEMNEQIFDLFKISLNESLVKNLKLPVEDSMT